MKPRFRPATALMTICTLAATISTQMGCASTETIEARNEQRALVLEELGFLTNDPDQGWASSRRSTPSTAPRPTLLAGDWIALGWARLDTSIFGAGTIKTDRATYAGIVTMFYE